MTQSNQSRRAFLKAGSALSSMGMTSVPLGLNLLGMSQASAQTATDYKALVSIYLQGGNDAINTVLATDTTSWNVYTRSRGAIAQQQSAVLPITPITAQSGRSFALNANMGGMQRLFNSGRLAIIANLGPLLVPVTKANVGSLPTPRDLLSHSSQEAYWQCGEPQTGSVPVGWGGRMGDLFRSQNGSNSLFTCVGLGGITPFLTANLSAQYVVNDGASPSPNEVDAFVNTKVFGSSVTPGIAKTVATADYTNAFKKTYAGYIRNTLSANVTFKAALAASNPTLPAALTTFALPFDTNNTDNEYLGTFQNVLRVIAAGKALGLKRQIIHVEFGFYDTHGDSNRLHNDNVAQLADALEYFDLALANFNGQDLRNNVTAFTHSDFGRAMVTNSDGTDHGWGGHHFVLGGAVKGKDIYGRFPNYDLTGPDFLSDSSMLLPNLASDQYVATLAKWFGVGSGDMNTLLPYLKNFSTADLGFMKA